MTGSHKIDPIIIGKFAKPRCFNCIKEIPCSYYNNKSTWMTKEILSLIVCIEARFLKDKQKELLTTAAFLSF